MGKQSSAAPLRWLKLSLLFLAMGLSHAGYGVTPEIWRVASFEDFSAGEGERVAIEHPGRILLAPSYRVFAEVGESTVWSLVESPDGKTLYLGTGNKAEIYKVAVEPKSATGKAELFASLEGSTIQTMLLGKDGSLYAGVSPDGKVYRISSDGAVTLIGATKEKYIWGMELDSSGNLILATGDSGKILKMDPKGETEDLADLEEKHILSMKGDGKGSFYFGTSPSGWIGVVDDKKDVRILYDSEKDEAKALALDDDGNLFAGVVPTVKVEPPRDAPTPPGAGRQAGGSELSSDLIRIGADGAPTKVATTDNAAINCIHLWDDRIVLGTGDAGKLFGLGEYNRLDLIVDLEPKEILSVAARKEGGVWIATGNPAQILVLPLGTNEGGKFAADPLDAGASAQWGMMTWIAQIPEGATLDFQTRSGATKEPDDTWSDWSDPIVEAGIVPSPPARYLQWRARFGGTEKGVTAHVKEVEVVYQKFNQGPKIESVDLGGSGGGSSSAAAKSSNGGSSSSAASSASSSSTASAGGKKSSPTPGASTSVQIEWKANDPNGDDLVYRVDYRQVGETLWKEIEEDLKTTKHTWSLVGIPDGDYELRVQASDEIANPGSIALSDEWITETFRKDSTAPEVVEWKDQKAEKGALSVTAVIRDSLSRLVQVEVMVDGKEDEARPLLSADGILDEKEEEFEIRVEGLASGEHSLTLRAKDEVGNIGSGALTFSVP